MVIEQIQNELEDIDWLPFFEEKDLSFLDRILEFFLVSGFQTFGRA